MKSQITKCQRHYERALSIGGCPRDELAICALLDGFEYFQRTNGEEDGYTKRALDRLLSDAPAIRAGLRAWYRRCGENLDASQLQIRDRLSELIGEKLG